MTPRQVTGGQLLVDNLIAHDVDTIFGIPGIQLYELVDALFDAREGLSLIAPRHEQSTTYMADGYARVTGKPGVAMVVPGPGVLNATAGLATALACSSPVLLLCGQLDSQLIDDRKYGALHEIPDQTGILRSLTKWVGTARDAREIPDLVALAFHHLNTGVPGPVALEVPPDVLAARVETRTASRIVPAEATFPRDKLESIAALIARSERPYILAGGGAQAAGDAILDCATLLGCPVIQSRNGRGVVDATHPLVLDPYARAEVISDADLVIVIGSRMGTGAGGHIDLGTGNVININAEVSDLGYPRPTTEHALLGDARVVTEQIVDALRRLGSAPASTWTQSEIERIRTSAAQQLEQVSPQLEYLRAIRTTLPADTVLVSEYTQVGYVSTITYPASSPRSFISPGYQGTLGYGFATAIGAQVGAPDRRVVSISGDGGFSWTLPELATLARYRIPLIAIVFNDGRYGNVYRSQKYAYEGRVLASDLTNPDFMRLADAYGVESFRVHDAGGLRDALFEVAKRDAPALIEVEVDEFPSPWALFDEPGQ